MGIVDEDIARVRDTTDIVAIISGYTQLKRVGRRFSGLCPFHGEKTPSFSVNSEQGLYYCFGCGAKGDAITFMRETEQLDFVGAVEFLANKAGVDLRYTDKNEGADRAYKAKLHASIDKAVEWYHERLLSGSDAAAARAYLRQRGLDSETVRQYKIGWAPDGWDLLAKRLRLGDKELSDAGLGFVNKRGRQQDSFRARVLFPIFDAQGQAMGFGGRILPGAEGPKYKNSVDSLVYNKSRVLYGLNWAKTDVVKANEVIVCEGYTDVIGFARSGVGTAVATCGTALTEDHVRLLRRFAKRVVLAFDADSAGQNAAERFYEWEKKHDLDVVVANLPVGQDPGDLASRDPQRLRESVSEAKTFLGFRVERVLEAGDFGSVEGRAKTAMAALALVAEHPDPLVRDQYIMSIAGRCQMDADLLRAQPREKLTSVGPQSAMGTRREPVSSVELEALKMIVHSVDKADELIPIELFGSETNIAAYEALTTSTSIADAIERTDMETADLLSRLSVEEPGEEVNVVAAMMWKSFLERQLGDLARTRSSMGPAMSMQAFSEMVTEESWYRRQLEHFEDLDDRTQTASAVQSLLSWLNAVPAEVSTVPADNDVLPDENAEGE